MTRNTPASTRPALLALAILFVGIIGYGIARPDVRPAGLLGDFRAFYCAGRVAAARSDPYRAEPLGRCEHERELAPFLTAARGVVIPAPLPPYALLPFIVLARLPFVAAAIVWCFCIIGSIGITIWALRRATGIGLLPLLAAFALTDGYASICLGQVAPIAIAAIAVAAMLLRERRDEAAAIVAAIAMIEPHVGLPTCLAMFVWRSRTRGIFVAACVACTVISLSVGGAGVTLEYVRFVIPAHALSEVANEKQFSLTYALHRIGASDALAIRLGAMWYGAMLTAGLLIARMVAKRTHDNAAIVVIPPMLVLIGGPFVHVAQMSAALPAAFMLYGQSSQRMRRTIGIAIVALAIPWIQFGSLGTIFVLLAPLAAAILVATLVARRPIAAAGAAIFALVFVEELTFSLHASAADVSARLLAHYDPRAFAEVGWTIYVQAVGTTNVGACDLAKIPTMIGLVTLASATMAFALRPLTRRDSGSRVTGNLKEARVSRRIATR